MKKPIKKAYKKFKKEQRSILNGLELEPRELYTGDLILQAYPSILRDNPNLIPVDFRSYNPEQCGEFIKGLLITIKKFRDNSPMSKIPEIKQEPIDQVEERIRHFLISDQDRFQKYASSYWNFYKSLDPFSNEKENSRSN